MKQQVTKKQHTNLSDFSNINTNVDMKTQTHSDKKLIKPILHSVGLTLGKSNPVVNHSGNQHILAKLANKNGVSVDVYKHYHDHPFMQHVTKQSVL